MSRFAAITADLLARKGEAMPWTGIGTETGAGIGRFLEAPPVVRAPAAPPPSTPTGKDRACAVRMTAQDHERLGILAVKLGGTRQQLLKLALAQFLERQAQAHACTCLGRGDTEGCCG